MLVVPAVPAPVIAVSTAIATVIAVVAVVTAVVAVVTVVSRMLRVIGDVDVTVRAVLIRRFRVIVLVHAASPQSVPNISCIPPWGM